MGQTLLLAGDVVTGDVSERNQCHPGRDISQILASEFQLGLAQGLIGVNWKVCVPNGATLRCPGDIPNIFVAPEI